MCIGIDTVVFFVVVAAVKDKFISFRCDGIMALLCHLILVYNANM